MTVAPQLRESRASVACPGAWALIRAIGRSRVPVASIFWFLLEIVWCSGDSIHNSCRRKDFGRFIAWLAWHVSLFPGCRITLPSAETAGSRRFFAEQRGERRATQRVPPARANRTHAWRRRFSAAVGEESWPGLAVPETRSQEGLETVVVHAVPCWPAGCRRELSCSGWEDHLCRKRSRSCGGLHGGSKHFDSSAGVNQVDRLGVFVSKVRRVRSSGATGPRSAFRPLAWFPSAVAASGRKNGL